MDVSTIRDSSVLSKNYVTNTLMNYVWGHGSLTTIFRCADPWGVISWQK